MSAVVVVDDDLLLHAIRGECIMDTLIIGNNIADDVAHLFTIENHAMWRVKRRHCTN